MSRNLSDFTYISVYLSLIWFLILVTDVMSFLIETGVTLVNASWKFDRKLNFFIKRQTSNTRLLLNKLT